MRTLISATAAAAAADCRRARPEQNEFGDATTADKAAAEALRDAYALANASWLAQYDGNLGFFILLHWTAETNSCRAEISPARHGKT